MQDELLGSVALPSGAATEPTDANNTIEVIDSRPANTPTAEVTNPSNQSDATGAIGATGPPQDASTCANGVLLPSSSVREKLGGVSDMTLWRRLKHDPQFPRPIIMAGRRYWWESTIDKYINEQPRG